MKKTFRKLLIVFLSVCCVACLSAALAACGGSHGASSEWSWNDTTHWHACTKSGCSDKYDEEEHTFNDGEVQDDGTTVYTCTVCGATVTSELATYVLNVQSIGKLGISGVKVTLYDSKNVKVGDVYTGSTGVARWRDLTPGTYTAIVDDSYLPTGYYPTDDQLEITFSSTNRTKTINIETALITDATMPSGTTYSVGSVVYDFEYTGVNADGTFYTIKLSEYLETYNAVVLNFFYTACGPCQKEFPVIDEVYDTDGWNANVKFIAFDYPGLGDTLTYLQSWIDSTGYSFDFVYDSAGYYSAYSVIAFPTTVVIDRYGAVAYMTTGSEASTTFWTNLFETYGSDDYDPDYSGSGSSSGSDEETLTEASGEMPASEDIAAAINSATDAANGTFTYSPYMEDGVLDAYSWPWAIGEEDLAGVSAGSYIYTTNAKRTGSYSILVIDVSLKKGDAVYLDYYVSTEADYDCLYVQVDTVLQATLSGESTQWTTLLAYVALYDGDYQITLAYQKDSSNNGGDDTVYVSNLRIGTVSEAANESNDLLYNAANNYTTATTVTGSDGETYDVSNFGIGYGYVNYVSVYLASDGYYHVDINESGKTDGSAAGDDPYLLADLYYATPWNNLASVWQLAAAGTGLFDVDDENYKEGYADIIEEYAWVQTYAEIGYVPVNQELHDLLVEIVADLGRYEGGKTEAGIAYPSYLLENQWLEVCRYYVHYGADHADGDLCYSTDMCTDAIGIKYAHDVGSVSSETTGENILTFEANIPIAILPVGYYYQITATEGGVYRIYTDEPYASDTDTTAMNPYLFIVDANSETIDENDDFDLSPYADASDSSVTLYNYNAELFVYLEADTIYYIVCAFSSVDDTGAYDVFVEYYGESYTYLTNLAVNSAYTYAEDGNGNYTYYLPIRVGYDNYEVYNGVYYVRNDDNTRGSKIYINLIGTTYLNTYSSYTIYEAYLSGAWSGTSYTVMAQAVAEALAYDESDDLYGYAVATEELVAILNAYANGGDTETDTTFASNAWMLAAYYYRTISE